MQAKKTPRIADERARAPGNGRLQCWRESPLAPCGFGDPRSKIDVPHFSRILCFIAAIFVCSALFGIVQCTFSQCLEPLGQWPYGSTYAVASSEDLVCYGNGRVLEVKSRKPTPAPTGKVILDDLVSDIVIDGANILVAAQKAGLVMIDGCNPSTPAVISTFKTSGYAVELTLHHGLVYVAEKYSGFQIVDVTNPAEPVEIAKVEIPSASVSSVIISGDVALVLTSYDGLFFYDISNPATPLQIGQFGFSPQSFASMAVQNQRVLISKGVSYPGMLVVDFSDPTMPVEVASFPIPTYSEVPTDLHIEGNILYAGGGYDLIILNISDLTSPTHIGEYEGPGWLSDFSVSPNRIYIADKIYGMRTLDTSDLSVPTEIDVIETGGVAYSVARSGDFVFVADGFAGMRTLDVSNPSKITEISVFQNQSRAERVFADKEIVYLAERDFVNEENWLRIFDVSNPKTPVEIGAKQGYQTRDITVRDGIAYMIENDLNIYDVSRPSSPTLLTSFDVLSPKKVSLAGNLAFVINGCSLFVIDISDPAAPARISTIHLDSYSCPCRSVATAGGIVLVGGRPNLYIVDVSEPSDPSLITTYPAGSAVYDVDLTDNIATLGLGERGIVILDVSDPAAPVEIASNDVPAIVWDMEITGDEIVTANWYSGVSLMTTCFTIFSDGFESSDSSQWLAHD